MSTAPDKASGHSPIYKKWWLWASVGAVVVAGGVVAVVFATRSSGSWNNLPDFGTGKTSAASVRW